MGNTQVPARRVVGAMLLCVVAPAALANVTAPAGEAATTFSVSGFVFRDLDNDGVRDAGEPGVPGVRVHRSTGNGTPTTTTNADGSYTLASLTATSSGYLRVESGWLRSQCAKLSCAAGPGPDNDYQTDNAFIRYPLSRLSGTTTNLNVGLLPDWPGSAAAAPAPVAGVVPANDVDVAARLSWLQSSCPGGVYLICGPGDTYSVSSQIHNQGTVALTGVTLVLRLPPGDRLATDDAQQDVSLTVPSTSPTVTARTVTPLDAANTVTVTLVGVLPPGGAALIRTNARVVGGPGTSGCVVGAMTSACPRGEPQGAPLTVAVTHIDQTGDPDSFGPDCPAGQAVALCATGIHDKQVEPDQVDPVGHNVDAAVGTSSTYNLSSRLFALRPTGTTAPGGKIAWRAVAFNDGPATVGPGWTLTVILPKATAPVTPSANALLSCTKGTTSSGYPYVRCTGKGPLSPGVSSLAVDVNATTPATAAPGSGLTALAYVAPPSGQGAETNPLGTAPSNPDVDVAQSPTDNDASATIWTAGP
jgi:hypothetical protein